MTQTPISSPSDAQRAADVTPPRGTPHEDAASQRETGDEIRDPEKKRLSEEAASHRKRAKELEAQLKAYQDAEQAARDAQLTETERLNKQYATLQEQHEALVVELAESRVREMVAGHASKFNFTIGARTLANLILADFDAIEFENGQPANIEQLLEKLAKHEPELVKAEQPAQPTPAQSRPPALPAMNQRATIPPPGGTPGRIPRLTDSDIWKK